MQNRDDWQSDKSVQKIKSFIADTKNRLKNVKQDYVAFLPPRNLSKNHGIFMFFFFIF